MIWPKEIGKDAKKSVIEYMVGAEFLLYPQKAMKTSSMIEHIRDEYAKLRLLMDKIPYHLRC